VGTENRIYKTTVKERAHRQVMLAIERGILVRPNFCENCGAKAPKRRRPLTGNGTPHARLDGHHDDYSKPLEVKWWCATCHRSWHTNMEIFNGRQAKSNVPRPLKVQPVKVKTAILKRKSVIHDRRPKQLKILTKLTRKERRECLGMDAIWVFNHLLK
jgi:hypothetical protein